MLKQALIKLGSERDHLQQVARALLLSLQLYIRQMLEDQFSSVAIPVHTLIIILHYTCCYDEIKGIQDLKICSHADSLILPLTVSALYLL